MGYYIQTKTNHDKAEALIKLGATYVPSVPTCALTFEQIPADKVLICVVDNRIFEAAGVIYSPEELAAFTDPRDFRPKIWLLLDKGIAFDLVPELRDVLVQEKSA